MQTTIFSDWRSLFIYWIITTNVSTAVPTHCGKKLMIIEYFYTIFCLDRDAVFFGGKRQNGSQTEVNGNVVKSSKNTHDNNNSYLEKRPLLN